MRIEEIDINNIEPNPWNPNEMTQDVFNHLKKEYKRVGFLQPVLVRVKGDKFQLIDGEHRWKAGKEFGLKTITAVVIEMDDKTAKLTSINMNKIKGTDNILKLATLLEDLKDTSNLDDILNMDKSELEQFHNLLETPTELPNFELDSEEKKRTITCPNCGEIIEL